jgi:hypothetical protein
LLEHKVTHPERHVKKNKKTKQMHIAHSVRFMLGSDVHLVYDFAVL